MVDAVADSSSRIFRIISAIKDYSYMDQAAIQDVDLVQSVENALALLHPAVAEDDCGAGLRYRLDRGHGLWRRA